MEVQKKKGGLYPVALLSFVMLILLNAYCCNAAVVVKSNTTTVRYNNGRLEESLIEYDLELEFLMNPYISRVLDSDPYHPTFQTGNPQSTPCEPTKENPNPCSGGKKCPLRRNEFDRTPCP